jgi:hypothetical protein
MRDYNTYCHQSYNMSQNGEVKIESVTKICMLRSQDIYPRVGHRVAYDALQPIQTVAGGYNRPPGHILRCTAIQGVELGL